MHGGAEVRKLCEVESVLDGLLERFPIPAEVTAYDTSGGSAYGMDATPRNELVQCAAPALVNAGLKPCKGLFTEPFRFNDFVVVSFQLI